RRTPEGVRDIAVGVKSCAAGEIRSQTQSFDLRRLDCFEFVSSSHPPSLSATSIAARRNSFARACPSLARATTMPPTHSAAIASAEVRLEWSFLTELRCNMSTIASNTVWKACFALLSLRATSLGSATIGQELSISSRCCRDRYARTLCGPASVVFLSTWIPSQPLFHSGSVKKHCITSAYKSLLLAKCL